MLPRDATPVDFAYAIHSDIGTPVYGAKVNGRIVPLRYTLQNGDSVEIMTQAGHKPSKDWLSLRQDRSRAQQDQARHQRQRAAEGDRDRPEIPGEGSAASRRAVEASHRRDLLSVAGEYGFGKVEDLYAALGLRQVFGAPGAAEARSRAGSGRSPGAGRRPFRKHRAAASGRRTNRTATSSASKASTTCWSIAPSAATRSAASPIVGYVTRGKGVAVHSKRAPTCRI